MGGQVKVAHDSPGAKYCSICNAYHPGEPCYKPTEAQRGEAVSIMMRYKDIEYVSALTGKPVSLLLRWLMVYEGTNGGPVKRKHSPVTNVHPNPKVPVRRGSKSRNAKRKKT